jgi:TRAP-type uncharacterized transport system substrate-binding protein
MMNNRRLFRWAMCLVVGALLTSVIMSVARAQTLVVATGAEKGSTYTQMFTELAAACTRDKIGATLQAKFTNGSVQNLQLLTGNQVHGAFVQSDFLFLMSKTDKAKVENVKTLVALHPEEVHFIARSDTKKEGGYGIGKFTIGGKDVSFNSLADLRGRQVGAVGGSLVSAQAISQFSGLDFVPVGFPSNDALKEALLAGKIDAAVVVAGAPSALVESLDGRYRLLPVDDRTAAVLKDIYTPAVLSYTNLNQSGVSSLSTQALFVTRTFDSANMRLVLAKLRNCFNTELPNIKDSLGTHAKWQNVKAGDTGKWPAYDLK